MTLAPAQQLPQLFLQPIPQAPLLVEVEMKRKKTQTTKRRPTNVKEQKKSQQARNVAFVESGVTRKKNAKKLIAQRVVSMVTRQTTARLNHAYIVERRMITFQLNVL